MLAELGGSFSFFLFERAPPRGGGGGQGGGMG